MKRDFLNNGFAGDYPPTHQHSSSDPNLPIPPFLDPNTGHGNGGTIISAPGSTDSGSTSLGSGGSGGSGSTPSIHDLHNGHQRQDGIVRRIGGKANVSSACAPCKKAHLACDVGRPCKRCSNMGKEAQCEDVPHKKRGRPKIPKSTPGAPYARRTPASSSTVKKQSREQPAPPQSFPDPPLFTVFTTIDLRILRCTPTSYPLTGFAPQDFKNTYLFDWVSPNERHLIEMEHSRLMSNPMGPGQLHTDRDAQEAIEMRSERSLLMPVDGMREPYPNQNVRILRADRQYSVFNVRLHLGGGLGGSLWHPDTLGKVYFVISLLLLPQPPPSAPAPGPPPPEEMYRQHTDRKPDFINTSEPMGRNDSPNPHLSIHTSRDPVVRYDTTMNQYSPMTGNPHIHQGPNRPPDSLYAYPTPNSSSSDNLLSDQNGSNGYVQQNYRPIATPTDYSYGPSYPPVDQLYSVEVDRQGYGQAEAANGDWVGANNLNGQGQSQHSINQGLMPRSGSGGYQSKSEDVSPRNRSFEYGTRAL